MRSELAEHRPQQQGEAGDHRGADEDDVAVAGDSPAMRIEADHASMADRPRRGRTTMSLA